MSDIKKLKSTARKNAVAARKSAHAGYTGRTATDNLLALLDRHRGKPMAAYMPIRSEIDCLPAMVSLDTSNPVAVPVVCGAGRPLEFHRWHADSPIKDGPYGARVPVNADIVIPSVVILPLLAFDVRGYRLGYGGGFYDRTLEQLRAQGPVLAVGFAYQAQEISQVPTEGTDQPMDAIVTETGARWFSVEP